VGGGRLYGIRKRIVCFFCEFHIVKYLYKSTKSFYQVIFTTPTLSLSLSHCLSLHLSLPLADALSLSLFSSISLPVSLSPRTTARTKVRNRNFFRLSPHIFPQPPSLLQKE